MRYSKGYGEWLYTIFNYLLVMIVVVASFYPFYYIIIASISDGIELMKGNIKFWPKGINFESYKTILSDPLITRAYTNTIIYTVSGTLVNLFCTTLCAYPLSRRNLYGRSFFMGLITLTMFFSGGLIPTYLVIQKLGFINTIWAIILPGAISTYNMIIMRTFFQGIPDSLYESAYLDGANDIRVLFSIVLPLSVPIMATMVIFYSVGHWNSYFDALIYLNDRNKFPMQVILRNMVNSSEYIMSMQQSSTSSEVGISVEMTIKYSIIVVTILPILFVYPFAQKYFIKGVMIGSLKG
jgi:putative aldouronate transport system permease protein